MLIKKLICVDIGNRNIKIGYFKSLKEKPQIEVDIKESSLELIEKFLKKYKDSPIYAISVVPSIKEKIEENFDVKFLTHKDFKEIKNPYRNKERLGIDRLVNVFGAINLFRQDVIVINFGTAITIDVAFKNGDFKGGLIIPSLETQIETLNKKTALINVNEIYKDLKLIGKSTEECVNYGIKNVLIFGIKSILNRLKTRYRSKNFKIILTGGGSENFKKFFKNSKHFPFLTLYALYIKFLKDENYNKLT
ncbi:MAG: type III pantothenate kinase [Candidatus Hydrothermales bacterium]